MTILKKLDNGLMNAAEAIGIIVRSVKQWSIKKWWQAMLIKRQLSYVKELRDNIVVTKRGLAHLQRVHEEQNRKFIKMQNKLT